MALRDQPYLPLYVQDFMTDEKLAECSAASTGVYIRIMCLMHKSEPYGKILLKQKHKQTDNQIKNFASQLTKQMPYDFHTVANALVELIDENVLSMENDVITQKRMVKDNEISEKRAFAGKSGGKKTQKKNKKFAQANALAKTQANTENEIETEIEIESVIDFGNGGVGEKPPEVTYPFGDGFKKNWEQWKLYKKDELKFRYKTVQSEQAALNSLVNLAKGNEETAIRIIHQSMANGWKGLFELKNNSNERQTSKTKQPTGANVDVGSIFSKIAAMPD